jgi:acetyltransferase-like isoleucine patch superfamily enzyme
MARGRALFVIARPILLCTVAILRLLPAALVRNLWGWVDGVPGVLGSALRYVIARRLALSVGDNVHFGQYVEVRTWEKLSIGSNVSIHRNCYLEALGGITIGNDVSIAHQTSILSFEHSWEDLTRPIKDNELILQPVVIHDDVWVGCGVRILAGVQLRPRTVVAAGAVVARSYAGGVVLGGVPAKPIKDISMQRESA